MINRSPRIGAAMIPLLLSTAAAPAGVLHVEVSNVRATTGHVHVDICTEAQFLKDCALSGNAPARIGTTIVTVTGVPAGRYAAQVYYDQNGNGKVDRALFGVPKEGVGFSNDAKIRLSAPKFAAAAFGFDGREQAITLRLRYFIGPDAPR